MPLCARFGDGPAPAAMGAADSGLEGDQSMGDPSRRKGLLPPGVPMPPPGVLGWVRLRVAVLWPDLAALGGFLSCAAAGVATEPAAGQLSRFKCVEDYMRSDYSQNFLIFCNLSLTSFTLKLRASLQENAHALSHTSTWTSLKGLVVRSPSCLPQLRKLMAEGVYHKSHSMNNPSLFMQWRMPVAQTDKAG